MKVDRIYYCEDMITDFIVHYLRKKRSFRRMRFVPLDTRRIVQLAEHHAGFDIREEHAILIWGWGADHDMSYYFSPPFPYSKSVDDAHCDFFPPYHAVNCANHNFFILQNDPNAQTVEVLGCAPNHKGAGALPEELKVSPMQEGEPEKPYSISEGLESAVEGAVHKSIDLDVIHGFPCIEKYANAQEWVTLEKVQERLAGLMQRADVVRLDTGGVRWDALYDGHIFPWQNWSTRKRAINAYRRLIETCLDFR